MQVAGDVTQLEAVRRGERQDDGVLGRRGLKLEIERAAEALAQGEAPGAVDAAAEGRMDDELHAARFVEEALEDDALLRRQRAERRARGREITGQLCRRGGRDSRLADEPGGRALHACIELRLELRTQPRDARRELVGTARGLAEPEGNGGWLAVCVLDADAALLHAQDAV